jgi:hypothetical protein
MIIGGETLPAFLLPHDNLIAKTDFFETFRVTKCLFVKSI